MYDYEKLLKGKLRMNAVICFSPTNQSLKVASYFSNTLSWKLYNLTSFNAQTQFDYTVDFQYLVVCFPVYSQNIPLNVESILKKIKAEYFVILATYGKMGKGNVIYKAKNLISGKIIGGAYIPSRHSYKDNGEFLKFSKLNELINRIDKKETNQIIIPKESKNIFANFFPHIRSQLGVKMKKNKNCDECNYCNIICPSNAIHYGQITKKCLRCLKCYYECPNKGLSIKYSIFLRLYLRKDKQEDLIIY